MASILLSGPAGAAKSALALELLQEWSGPVVLIDFQSLTIALTGVVRGPDGRYPLRDERLLPIIEYLRRAALTAARNRDLDPSSPRTQTATLPDERYCSMNWGKVLSSESSIPAARLSRLDCQTRPRVPYRPNVRVQSIDGTGGSDDGRDQMRDRDTRGC